MNGMTRKVVSHIAIAGVVNLTGEKKGRNRGEQSALFFPADEGENNMFRLNDIVIITGNGERDSLGLNVVHHNFDIGTACRVIEEEETSCIKAKCIEGDKKGMWQYVNVWDVKLKDYNNNSQAATLLKKLH